MKGSSWFSPSGKFVAVVFSKRLVKKIDKEQHIVNFTNTVNKYCVNKVLKSKTGTMLFVSIYKQTLTFYCVLPARGTTQRLEDLF